MGFKGGCCVLGIVLLSRAAAGARDQDPQIVVLVNNAARVAAAVLYHAEVQAGRVLEEAGIAVVWVNCGEPAEPDRCKRTPGQNEFVVHIVPTGVTRSDFVFGEAFLDENGYGKYCDIFFDRVEALYSRSDTDISKLLGAIAAHEVGHLLLGSHSHSAFGIMQPTWNEASLRTVEMGTLSFLPQESKRMRRRIRGDELGVSPATSRSASLRLSTASRETLRIRQGFLP